MTTGALTESLDVAQVVLYVFWLFFAALIFYLRREDRREGYPLENDTTGKVGPKGAILMAAPKTFLLPDGGTYSAPNDDRDTREIKAARTAAAAGSPLEPTGDPMVDAVGPASYAMRADHIERTREGEPLIVPLRVAHGYSIDKKDRDPRGLSVVAADGKVAGVVREAWVDRADVMVRYLEVELSPELGGTGTRLLPMTMLRIESEPARVRVESIKSVHFPQVPQTKKADEITLLEEDQISAYYAGGRLYADPKRVRPLV